MAKKIYPANPPPNRPPAHEPQDPDTPSDPHASIAQIIEAWWVAHFHGNNWSMENYNRIHALKEDLKARLKAAGKE
jgi:hypothetical protein